MAKFKVVRAHEGDRFYAEGEIREGKESEFKHLIPHVLVPAGDAPKSEQPVESKSLGAAPENKAEEPKGNKAGNRQKGE